jgi:hypothetical protein
MVVPLGRKLSKMLPGNAQEKQRKARVILTLLLCVVGAGVCLADDPQIGTWKLNEAKSKIGAGSPKLTTFVYEAAGDTTW